MEKRVGNAEFVVAKFDKPYLNCEQESTVVSSHLQIIGALKSVVTVLCKHGAFIQLPATHLQGIADILQFQMQKHASLFQGVLTHSERRTIAEFVQAPSCSLQSGEIYCILEQMKETFEKNLSSQKGELENQKAYEELEAAMTDEELELFICSIWCSGLHPLGNGQMST